MRRGADSRVERHLARVRAPDEEGAQERAWEVVRHAYAERIPVPRRRPRARLLLVPASLLAVAAVTLIPAGASVRHWINRTFGVSHPSRALFSLPASGRLLVSGPGGAWIVSADGARRRLGSWSQASWSPNGRYVAVAAGDQLAAVDPRGTVRWAVARPGVRFPRWFSPSGYRVAYLSRSSLRVIAGDGTGDALLAARVAQVAPAWRPGHPYQLAYASLGGRLVVRDADTGLLLWSRSLASPLRLLAWSADGSRLIVLTRAAVLVFGGDGRASGSIALDPRQSGRDAAVAPDGRAVALLGARDVTVAQLAPRLASLHRVFAGDGLRQVAWTSDGRWLLVTWPAADQWIFVRASGRPRIEAVSRIAEQFSGSSPAIDGWCCG